MSFSLKLSPFSGLPSPVEFKADGELLKRSYPHNLFNPDQDDLSPRKSIAVESLTHCLDSQEYTVLEILQGVREFCDEFLFKVIHDSHPRQAEIAEALAYCQKDLHKELRNPQLDKTKIIQALRDFKFKLIDLPLLDYLCESIPIWLDEDGLSEEPIEHIYTLAEIYQKLRENSRTRKESLYDKTFQESHYTKLHQLAAIFTETSNPEIFKEPRYTKAIQELFYIKQFVAILIETSDPEILFEFLPLQIFKIHPELVENDLLVLSALKSFYYSFAEKQQILTLISDQQKASPEFMLQAMILTGPEILKIAADSLKMNVEFVGACADYAGFCALWSLYPNPHLLSKFIEENRDILLKAAAAKPKDGFLFNYYDVYLKEAFNLLPYDEEVIHIVFAHYPDIIDYARGDLAQKLLEH